MTPLQSPQDFKKGLEKSGHFKLITEYLLNGPAPITKQIKRSKISGPGMTSDDFRELRQWRKDWKSLEAPGVSVDYDGGHNVRHHGRQHFPKSVTFDSPEAMCAFVSPSWLTLLRRTKDRFTRLVEFDPRLDGLVRAHALYRDLPDSEFENTLKYLAWRMECPDVECSIRDVHIPGMDTKFIETHEDLIRQASYCLDLVKDPEAKALNKYLGFADYEQLDLHVRMPKELASRGLKEPWMRVQPSNLAREEFQRIIMFENRENFLNLEPSAGTLVVWGEGYRAAELMRRIPWTDEVDVFYSGDCDSHGFEMLRQVRQVAPHTQSVFMDIETVEANWEFGVEEPTSAFRSVATNLLNHGEAKGLALLQEHSIRIEQQLIQGQKERLSDIGLGPAILGAQDTNLPKPGFMPSATL